LFFFWLLWIPSFRSSTSCYCIHLTSRDSPATTGYYTSLISGLDKLKKLKEVQLHGSYGEQLKQELEHQISEHGNKPVLSCKKHARIETAIHFACLPNKNSVCALPAFISFNQIYCNICALYIFLTCHEKMYIQTSSAADRHYYSVIASAYIDYQPIKNM
jgi:hypothetical protein